MVKKQAAPSPPDSDHVESFRSKGDQLISYKVGDTDAPMMVKHTPARLAWDIWTHNQRTKFTPVMVMAMPGFGKTTFNRCVIHYLHEHDPSYSINYYQNTDILVLDRILENLPKRKPAILVFDDVSYILENLRQPDRIKILDRLSRIRETIDPDKETPSILFMDYHYSYAMPKTFRQSNFKVYLSVTDEERENYMKQMGYQNKTKIQNYIRIFIAMMRYGRFWVKKPSNPAEQLTYYTDKPFRPALVSNYGELHLTLFHKIYGCEKCAFKKSYDKPDPDFWVSLVKKYGFTRVHQWLRIYAYMHTGRKTLLRMNDRSILAHIGDHHKQSKIDLVAIVDLLKQVRKTPQTEQEALFILGLNSMEGRIINHFEVTKKQAKKALEEADALGKKGSQETIDLPEIEEDDLDLAHSVAQYAGSLTDDDADDFDLEAIEGEKKGADFE